MALVIAAEEVPTRVKQAVQTLVKKRAGTPFWGRSIVQMDWVNGQLRHLVLEERETIRIDPPKEAVDNMISLTENVTR